MDATWTIDELIRVSAAALESAEYEGPASGRIRETPDKRTIRYYTTLGLLDRPAEFRGRTAFYGRRHVLQLTAIKRLQSKGMSLVQIQQALSGADDRRLESWAGIPEEFWEKHKPAIQAPVDPDALLASRDAPQPADSFGAGMTPATPAKRAAFWREPPAMTSASPTRTASDVAPLPELHAIAALELAPGVKLLLESTAAERINRGLLQELAPATEFLVKELRRLKLIA
jgi:DNA-binding transcriptional MerR regulator